MGEPEICLWFLRKENTEDVLGAGARLHFPLRARDIDSSDPGGIRNMVRGLRTMALIFRGKP
eukprot:2984431-Heterocapsa_arctica.AAC.1